MAQKSNILHEFSDRKQTATSIGRRWGGLNFLVKNRPYFLKQISPQPEPDEHCGDVYMSVR